MSSPEQERGNEPSVRIGPLTRIAISVEVLCAIVLGLLAWWAWQRSIIPMAVPQWEGGPAVVNTIIGSFVLLAVAAGTVMGLLVLDVIRRLVLHRVAQRQG